MKKNYLVFFAVMLSLLAGAQPQQYNWYFGVNAALNFSSGTPVAVNGSNMKAFEGCDALSDDNGNLLFYTNGDSIWNKNNSLMTGGYMTGGYSSTQTLVLRKPGSVSLYYVFHTGDHMSTGDFRYSIVDMCLNNGLGDISPNGNNVLIEPSMEEKICAVRHANGSDYWIIVHQKGNNTFHAYLLSAAGLNLTPVTSSLGTTHGSNCMIGPLKSNHTGNKLVGACTFCAIAEMYDFDNSTGLLSNATNILSYITATTVYGVEFSPNDQLLYISTTFLSNYLFQIDLSNFSSLQLAMGVGQYSFGTVQLAPDHKIYLARYPETYLDVVNNPDVTGVGCNYQTNAVTLPAGSSCNFGLPNNLTDSILPPPIQSSFTAAGSCFADTFISTLYSGYDSVAWNFGDPASGANNYSNDTNVVHQFSQPGIYYVQLIVFIECISDTVLDTLTITPGQPLVDLGNDTTLCTGQVFSLNANNPGSQFFWSTGDTSQIISVNASGNYWVLVTNGCGTGSDTVNINFQTPPALGIFPDTTICIGDTIQLFTNGGFNDYQWWPPGFHISCDTCQNPFVNPDADLNYIVTANFNGCIVSDTIHIVVINSYITAVPDTSILCLGDSVHLTVTAGNYYVWIPSAGLSCSNCQSPTAAPSVTTDYTVTVTFSSCVRGDTVHVEVVTPVPFNILNDTLCNGATITLNAPAGFDSYSWSPSTGLSCDNCANPVANPTATTTYTITISDGPCVISDEVIVYVDDINLVAGDDTTIYSGTSAQLWADGAYNYQWSPTASLSNDTSSTPIASPGETTVYTVSASSELGCKQEAEVTVTVVDPCSFVVFPNAFSPNGDGMNDFFFAMNSFFLSNYNLKIFSRWGQLMFESTDPNQKWDGKFKGLDCEIDVYVYTMSGTCRDEQLQLKGNVTLVR